MKALFIGIAILIIYFIIIFIVLYFITNRSTLIISSTDLETVKNTSCKTYVKQYPACNDWTEFNVTWQKSEMTFRDFMANQFNCSTEYCARSICSCPGY